MDAFGATVEVREDEVLALADRGEDGCAHPHVLEELAKARVALPTARQDGVADGQDEESGGPDHQQRRGSGQSSGVEERRAHFLGVDGGDNAERAPRHRLVGGQHRPRPGGHAGGAGVSGKRMLHQLNQRRRRVIIICRALARRARGFGEDEPPFVHPADQQPPRLVQAPVNGRKAGGGIGVNRGVRLLLGQRGRVRSRRLDDIAAVAVELGLVQRAEDEGADDDRAERHDQDEKVECLPVSHAPRAPSRPRCSSALLRAAGGR